MFLLEKNAQWPHALILGLFLSFQSALGQSGRTSVPSKPESKPPIPCEETKEPPPPLNIMFNVFVTDSSGKPVTDLAKDEFRIFENEIPQQLSVFEKREGPLNLGLLVDTSGSMRGWFNQAALFARAMILTKETDEEVFLTRFISTDKIELAQDWTRDQAPLLKALDALRIEGGQSAIVDAVYESAQHLVKHKTDARRRSALVLITDGEDRASYYSANQLLSLLRKLDAQVFVLAFTSDIETTKARTKSKQFLLSLTQKTGGRAVFVAKKTDVLEAVNIVRKELSAQYRIGYQSGDQTRDNLTRKIRTELADKPGRGSPVVFARTDYVTLCQ